MRKYWSRFFYCVIQTKSYEDDEVCDKKTKSHTKHFFHSLLFFFIYSSIYGGLNYQHHETVGTNLPSLSPFSHLCIT